MYVDSVADQGSVGWMGDGGWGGMEVSDSGADMLLCSFGVVVWFCRGLLQCGVCKKHTSGTPGGSAVWITQCNEKTV